MDDFTLARVIHVLAVVLWIGGVAFVTLALIPAIRDGHPPGQRLAQFHRVEARFSGQARIWVALTGASGLWMLWRGQIWDRFTTPDFWWMHAMVAVWLVFAAMLYVIEPLALHRRMARSATPERDFARLETLHRLLLAASLITIAGAVGGAHGLF
jgi:uncharacterized membrane protein